MSDVPQLTPLSPRAAEIVSVARELLETGGREAVTMRAIAERLGIRAPSLYKHVPDKAALEAALIEQGLAELGAALYEALDDERPVRALLEVYRRRASAHPNLYRLGTAGRLPRERLAPGLEDWAGRPFFVVTGEAKLARALWTFAHGMVILELDGRFPDDADLDGTWAEGAHVFESRLSTT